MTFICAPGEAPPAVIRVLALLRECCVGAMEEGPLGCSCWEPIYDLEQQAPLDVLAAGQRTEMCADCAYRPDSPERTGDDRHLCSDEGELDDVARGRNPFWCHQGLRKPVAFKHASLGIVVPADADAYDPPMRVVDGQRVPIKADGTAGDRCAGWMARKQQLAAAEGMDAVTSDRAGGARCEGGYVSVFHPVDFGTDRAPCPSCGRVTSFHRITGRFKAHNVPKAREGGTAQHDPALSRPALSRESQQDTDRALIPDSTRGS